MAKPEARRIGSILQLLCKCGSLGGWHIRNDDGGNYVECAACGAEYGALGALDILDNESCINPVARRKRGKFAV